MSARWPISTVNLHTNNCIRSLDSELDPTAKTSLNGGQKPELILVGGWAVDDLMGLRVLSTDRGGNGLGSTLERITCWSMLTNEFCYTSKPLE